MKMTAEHFELLKRVVDPWVSPSSKQAYKDAGLSKERYSWDMLWRSGFDAKHLVGILYGYLDDNHIQTALFKIVGEY
jgi:hypothetical protein